MHYPPPPPPSEKPLICTAYQINCSFLSNRSGCFQILRKSQRTIHCISARRELILLSWCNTTRCGICTHYGKLDNWWCIWFKSVRAGPVCLRRNPSLNWSSIADPGNFFKAFVETLSFSSSSYLPQQRVDIIFCLPIWGQGRTCKFMCFRDAYSKAPKYKIF